MLNVSLAWDTQWMLNLEILFLEARTQALKENTLQTQQDGERKYHQIDAAAL